jgi:hypothetical protein
MAVWAQPKHSKHLTEKTILYLLLFNRARYQSKLLIWGLLQLKIPAGPMISMVTVLKIVGLVAMKHLDEISVL